MEETLTNWDQFFIFHESVRAMSWPILIKVAIVISVFSILRSVFFYATARKFEEFQDASIFVLSVDKFYYVFFATEEELEKDRLGQADRITGKGGHVLGGFLDAAVWAILGTVLIWLWPIIFAVAILFGPIQISRNHFMRKKIFIAKLKGEELDI